MTSYWIAAPLREPLVLLEPPSGWAAVPFRRQHMTLCYLGHVSQEQATRAMALALEIVGREGFSIHATRASFFGDDKEALVLELDKSARRAMTQMRHAVRRFSSPEMDRWPPRPHLTLALRAADTEALEEAIRYKRAVNKAMRGVPVAFGAFALERSR